jgi:3-hydroxyacyl-[acyl-carrier-protein] dehydratase
MAAEPFIDLNTIDLSQCLADKDQIYQRLPHRYEFMQLDKIIWFDKEQGLAVAQRDIREDEFWVKGHIPGRPIFPGVLMVESAAHVASYISYEYYPESRFVGFGGIDAVKFRGEVTPPSTVYIIMKKVDARKRRIICDTQAIVEGKLVFEGQITGMPL